MSKQLQRVHSSALNPKSQGSVDSEAKVAGPRRAQRSEDDAQEEHSHHNDVHYGGGGEWRADEQASRLLFLVATWVGPLRRGCLRWGSL